MTPRTLPTFTLRDFQRDASTKATNFLRSSARGQSLLLTGPTGSGKSYIASTVHSELAPHHHLIVPSIEIAEGVLTKLLGGPPEGDTRKVTEATGIYTAGRYLNLLKAAAVDPLPRYVTFDEAHHTEAATYEAIWDFLGRPPRLGLTATAYRGTPKETADLRASWGEPHPIITLKDAVGRGVIALPTFEVWPLLNDDTIKIVNGEFHVASLDAMVKDKAADLVQRVGQFFDPGTGLWDRPTMMALSSVEQVKYVEHLFRSAGLPVASVTGTTTGRNNIFADVVGCRALLLQIKVVGEGVDLPIRRLIDCAPTMSPVFWMQRVGRITRPSDRPPECIVCCHNLTRHGYLFEGLIPAGQVRAAQKAWGDDYKPTRRHLGRAIGLEGFGKFTVAQIPLADGLTGLFYGLQTRSGSDAYALFVHPVEPEPLVFHKVKHYIEGEVNEWGGRVRDYGREKWRRIDRLPDLDGCLSLPPSEVTPAQLRWWKNVGKKYGLDHEAVPNRRQFEMLPILRDAGIRIRSLS